MSLWKDNTVSKPTPEPAYPPTFEAKEPPARVETPPPPPKPEQVAARAPAPAPAPAPARSKESVIAADLTIEGKIEGGGSVRIAGRFKGDVNVQGDLTIEAGAKLTGSVRADKVTISGELEGNVLGASSIDLQKTGIVVGDLKARSLSVASGATMRGKAEFGGDDGEGPKVGKHGAGATEIGTRQ